MTAEIQIYTDGACSGNPGPGGWGAYLKSGKHQKEISGYEIDTTNNRMELLAAIKALEQLKKPSKVDLYTDSIYLKKGMTEWLPKWMADNWRRRHRGEVKNLDLWQKLNEVSNKHNIIWHWVKSHANNEGNIKADELAVRARKEAERLVNVHK